VEARLPGGFCVVASTAACLDVFSDFLVRWRLCADGAAAARQRRSGGATGILGSCGWRDAGSKRRAAPIGRYAAASERGGHRAKA
jgi:hypothetical protein